jgi:hypothetical protein
MYQSSRALRSEHNEAVRLAWKSIHVPFGTILLGAFLLACVLSAVMQVIALGPSNAMPKEVGGGGCCGHTRPSAPVADSRARKLHHH